MKIKALSIAGFLVSSLFLLPACEEKDETPQPVSLPAVNTLGVEIPAGGGVILRAGMENYSQLSGYGFMLGTDQLIASGRKLIPVQENHKDGIFTATIENGLYKGKAYFFRGYMVVAGDTVLGEHKSFVSGGSIAPVIESVFPEKGHLEDTIQIKGKYFGTNKSYVSATFEGKSATVLNYNGLLNFNCINSPLLLFERGTRYLCQVTKNIKGCSCRIKKAIPALEIT